MNKLNYQRVFNTLVEETKNYLLSNNLKAMILGISGGIDSTVTAAICHEVSKQTGIPLIGRSLPIKNRNDEFKVSELVGTAFCNRFRVKDLSFSYKAILIDCLALDNKEVELMSEWRLSEIEDQRSHIKVANGNLQARCRMQYLYDLASWYNGLVMSTDNQTEYQLGFWTIHGDVGDFDPLQDLWKTEIYELAEYIFNMYDTEARKNNAYLTPSAAYYIKKMDAIKHSINLTPTDGLGISNSDLDQIGAKSYADVDAILQDYMAFCETNNLKNSESTINAYLDYNAIYEIEPDIVRKVLERHLKSEFKRKKAPIFIPRNKFE